MAKKKDDEKETPFGDYYEPMGTDPIELPECDECEENSFDLIDTTNGMRKKIINIKFHGLMPDHQTQAIEMIKEGKSLAEIAEYFGIPMSDISYSSNK